MKGGIEFHWREVGEVRLDMAGKPEFPTLSAKPGVYAFRFTGHEGTTLYVGEAENLQRRAAHYRNQGPSQATNVRLNERMRSHLSGNGRITMSLMGARGSKLTEVLRNVTCQLRLLGDFWKTRCWSLLRKGDRRSRICDCLRTSASPASLLPKKPDFIGVPDGI